MLKKRKDPKVGTGKKPKGSGRRLYTDENPRDTVSIKFATPADARSTVAKVKRVNKKGKLVVKFCNSLTDYSGYVKVQNQKFLVSDADVIKEKKNSLERYKFI